MKKLVFGVTMFLLAMTARPVLGANIALLDSKNTRDFFFTSGARYGATRCSKPNFLGPEEYQRYFLGWKYVLEGQPFNDDFTTLSDSPLAFTWKVITDDDIKNGKLDEDGYKVLILSNTASLDDAESMIIQQWVLSGGRLIATFGSGYKDIITDPRQDDRLKLQSGGTGRIHQLWHDPLTKAFGTQAITPDDPNSPGIDVAITKSFGPTDIFGLGIISYGAEANLLVPRPEQFRDALAFLTFDFGSGPDMAALKHLYPAILLTRMSKGVVVYFAFAPEFIVSLAFDLAGHCSVDSNYPGSAAPYGDPTVGPQAADFPNGFVGNPPTGFPQSTTGRVGPLLQLMKRTIQFMMTP